jgi:hypothetical protein
MNQFRQEFVDKSVAFKLLLWLLLLLFSAINSNNCIIYLPAHIFLNAIFEAKFPHIVQGQIFVRKRFGRNGGFTKSTPAVPDWRTR